MELSDTVFIYLYFTYVISEFLLFKNKIVLWNTVDSSKEKVRHELQNNCD